MQQSKLLRIAVTVLPALLLAGSVFAVLTGRVATPEHPSMFTNVLLYPQSATNTALITIPMAKFYMFDSDSIGQAGCYGFRDKDGIGITYLQTQNGAPFWSMSKCF